MKKTKKNLKRVVLSLFLLMRNKTEKCDFVGVVFLICFSYICICDLLFDQTIEIAVAVFGGAHVGMSLVLISSCEQHVSISATCFS